MQHILFIDIETVPKVWNFKELTEREQHLFGKKYAREIRDRSDQIQYDDAHKGTSMTMTYKLGPEEASNQIWREQAAFHAEFNKIACVSIGKIFFPVADLNEKKENLDPLTAAGIGIKIKSFTSQFEIDILKDLEKAMASYSSLCAHYGKEFDYPVLCRKYMMHRLPIPPLLNIQGLKPWEIPLIDTMEMWRFGSFKHTASLDLIANCFGIPSPKQEMDGSQVGKVYYEGTGDLGMEPDAGIKKIAAYCEQDVYTLINVYRCMTGNSPIENVVRV